MKPELFEIRPYTVRNGHVGVEVYYGGVALGETWVPERATLQAYQDAAEALLECRRDSLPAHQKIRIIETEGQAG